MLPAMFDPVLVPPTPTKTLPREETEGMTSGAVQPPGSGPRAEDSLHNHSRRSSRILGEETDGSTSFTDDEDIEDGNYRDNNDRYGVEDSHHGDKCDHGGE